MSYPKSVERFYKLNKIDSRGLKKNEPLFLFLD